MDSRQIVLAIIVASGGSLPSERDDKVCFHVTVHDVGREGRESFQQLDFADVVARRCSSTKT